MRRFATRSVMSTLTPKTPPLSRLSLKSFLATAREALTSPLQQKHPFTFVIGNESADLDSLCSAVVFSYVRTSSSDTLYIPLSNLPSVDLSLRPELIPVLSHANLKPSDLITLSDLPPLDQLSAQIAPDRTRWIVVDHNSLQGELGRLYGSRVVGCVDHHVEENKVPKHCEEEPRVVEPCGSCASLVVERCKESWNTFSRSHGDDNKGVGSRGSAAIVEAAYLALAPILIDTTNLTSESKVKPADEAAVSYLENLISSETGSDYSREEYFKEISTAKEDIGGLSLPDILRKDYKEWTENGSVKLGISSVVKDLHFLLEQAGGVTTFIAALQAFAEERDLSLCSIMTTSHPDGNFKRELLVWGLNGQGLRAVKSFKSSASSTLGLEQWEQGSLDSSSDNNLRYCWQQMTLSSSRKEVGPLLRSAITDRQSL